MYLLRSLLYLTAGLRVVTAATCYNSKGSRLGSEYTPCGTSGMCCGGNKYDVCLPNGLCQYTTQGKEKDTSFWREGCTDKSWGSATCLKSICAGSSEINSDGDGEMTPCDGTSGSAKWCCGGNTKCCGTGKEILLAAVVGAGSASSATSVIPVVAPVVAPTPTPTPAVVNNVVATTPTTPQGTTPVVAPAQNQETISSQNAASVQEQQPNQPAATPTLATPQTQVAGQTQAQEIAPAASTNIAGSPNAQSQAQYTILGVPTHNPTSSTPLNPKAAFQTSSSHLSTASSTSNSNSNSNTSSNTNNNNDDDTTTSSSKTSLSTPAKAGIAVSIIILILTLASLGIYIFVVRRSETWRSRHDVVEIVEYTPQMTSTEVASQSRTARMLNWARPAGGGGMTRAEGFESLPGTPVPGSRVGTAGASKV